MIVFKLAIWKTSFLLLFLTFFLILAVLTSDLDSNKIYFLAVIFLFEDNLTFLIPRIGDFRLLDTFVELSFEIKEFDKDEFFEEFCQLSL